MSDFTIGQRWISHSEPQLGLGIIAELDGRCLTVSFPAVAEKRKIRSGYCAISSS